VIVQTGWIPYAARTPEQQRLTDEWHESLPKFDDVCQVVDTPERVILHELEIRHTGALLPRIRQLTGSCVGCGGARSYTHAQIGDALLRGDAEEVKIPFPFATYGVGREIMGARGRGEGSFGGAQAQAIEKFGMLPWDSELATQPVIREGWATWTRDVELSWSHPSAWPKPRATVEAEAIKFSIQTVVKINDPDQAVTLLAQGYGITQASMFGTEPRVDDDVLVGRWNKEWAHQMSVGGYWKHPKHGLIFIIDNQWGDVHGQCPTLGKLGVNGSFWMLSSDFAKICKNDEVYGHSNTKGFPLRKFDWNNILQV
jgi:hypothetical protein